MVTAELYDVFTVLAHVDQKISMQFIPAWVRLEISKIVIQDSYQSVESVVVKSVESWIVATRGSELRKCRHQDKETVKRVVCQVNRCAMESPQKIKEFYHKVSFDIEKEHHYGFIIGKNGKNVKKIQNDFPGVRLSLNKLCVTISARSSENLCFIRSIMRTHIQDQLLIAEEYRQKHENDIAYDFPDVVESNFFDLENEIHVGKKYRIQLIAKKKILDCKKKNHVQESTYRKRAKGKKQALTV